jgi:hypothetical protein
MKITITVSDKRDKSYRLMKAMAFSGFTSEEITSEFQTPLFRLKFPNRTETEIKEWPIPAIEEVEAEAKIY